ncbi:hypothetical protein J7T55_001669 [Diaporthe amygdali]|uniref:uncharacterized protein n=1 Tax=Phomopsis amygdali TaxID=1214568 RepID=UPI0022FE07A0|nr:uncharacterized protein J7T55_001669 [Diaporthe amygdali]KAJ0115259.1 hypothetical protein J7T55_001669 [Diaporthe amygdali]
MSPNCSPETIQPPEDIGRHLDVSSESAEMATRSDDTLVCCGEPQESGSDDQTHNEKANHSRPPCRPHSHHRLCATVDTLTVVKRGRTNFAPAKQTLLKNSLLGIVGFLELANAGDFAANVWNEVPVPAYAVALMAVGGIFALLMSVFAFRDALLSLPDVCVLLEQCRRLRHERVERLKEEDGSRKQQTLDVDVLLDVVWRELGTETISRFGLDLLLGAGAVMIGVGTLMAIGGTDKKVWFASNLLSGYVGNAPLALYALINSAWACYICLKARQHWAAAAASLERKREKGRGLDEQDHPAWAAVRRRARNMQLYSAITGVASILGGVGSLMTATMWYGYAILIPVIISSVLCNVWWRHGLGYDRPLFGDDARDMSAASLMSEIEYVALAQDAFKRGQAMADGELGADLESLESVLGLIVANDLFEDFCLRLLRDKELATGLFPLDHASFTIEAAGLLEAARKQHAGCVLSAAKKCVREDGLRRFQSRERYLAEALMTFLYISHLGAWRRCSGPALHV